MKPFLMGTETEYAVSGGSRDGPMPAEEVYSLLNDAIRKERDFESLAGCLEHATPTRERIDIEKF